MNTMELIGLIALIWIAMIMYTVYVTNTTETPEETPERKYKTKELLDQFVIKTELHRDEINFIVGATSATGTLRGLAKHGVEIKRKKGKIYVLKNIPEQLQVYQGRLVSNYNNEDNYLKTDWYYLK